MKRSAREIAARLVILLIGLIIAHLGVTLFLLSNLGADPFNVLVQGTFRSLQAATQWGLLTHGRTHMALCFLIIAVLLVVDRSYVKIGTFVCMFAGGPIIDVWTEIAPAALVDMDSMVARVAMLVVGCVVLAYGMTMVIKSDAGTGPNDLVAVVTADKLNKPFAIVRVATDLLFVLAGLLLGGIAGVGTVICMFLVGPTAQVFLPINERLVGAVAARTAPTQ